MDSVKFYKLNSGVSKSMEIKEIQVKFAQI